MSNHTGFEKPSLVANRGQLEIQNAPFVFKCWNGVGQAYPFSLLKPLAIHRAGLRPSETRPFRVPHEHKKFWERASLGPIL